METDGLTILEAENIIRKENRRKRLIILATATVGILALLEATHVVRCAINHDTEGVIFNTIGSLCLSFITIKSCKLSKNIISSENEYIRNLKKSFGIN